MNKRGEIYCEDAYAQGKMLDHSSWNLPRNITPSDIDMCFDNNGNIIACEISSNVQEWTKLQRGQFLLYFNFIGPLSKHIAVLCYHNVDKKLKINTLNDIISFQIMIRKNDEVLYTPIYGSSRWEKFIKSWYNDSNKLRKSIFGIITKQAELNQKWIKDYEEQYIKEYGCMPW